MSGCSKSLARVTAASSFRVRFSARTSCAQKVVKVLMVEVTWDASSLVGTRMSAETVFAGLVEVALRRRMEWMIGKR
jgi:hypothetical protein